MSAVNHIQCGLSRAASHDQVVATAQLHAKVLTLLTINREYFVVKIFSTTWLYMRILNARKYTCNIISDNVVRVVCPKIIQCENLSHEIFATYGSLVGN